MVMTFNLYFGRRAILRKAPDWSVGMMQWWRVWRAVPIFKFWTPNEMASLDDITFVDKHVISIWKRVGTNSVGFTRINPEVNQWKTRRRGFRQKMVRQSPIAPLLLTEDDESEEILPTMLTTQIKRNWSRREETHRNRPPKQAESHWPQQRKATALRSYRAN